MPSRLNKRQQRELEELEALGGPVGVEESSGEEIPVKTIVVPSFSNLLEPEDIESESDKEGSVMPAKPRKKKKKKKSTAPEATPLTIPTKASKIDTSSTIPSTKSEKKALKRAKAKEKKAGDNELEQALAELSIKYPELQKYVNTTPDSQSLANLLAVSLAHLDSEAEMRKFFGAKVIQANKSGSSGTSGSSPRRHAALQRSNLTRPQRSWWSASQREGLSIRSLTDKELQLKQELRTREISGEKWWTVEYSQRYKSMTKGFIQAVMSGHPEALWELQRKLPWHADNLLQLAEVYRHREEYSLAVDFVDRAIFTYERAFIGAFNFTSGINRLDFDRVENRPFFLAIHRQIADLQRRGCTRTAFEFARLLYSLDPWDDPHGALYHLELLALKAGMGQWLIDVYDYFVTRRKQLSEKHDTYVDPSLLPGVAYARALALRILESTKADEGHPQSTKALKEAILSFPAIVPLLADKLDVTLPASIRAHRDFKIETDGSSSSASAAALHLLSHMYAQQSFALWKEAEHSAWFARTVIDTFSTLPSSLPVTDQRAQTLLLLQDNNIRYSIYRHVTVLESTHRRLFVFIPPRALEEAKSLACDPLPPPTALSRYDEEYFQDTEDMPTLRARTRQERVIDERQLAQIIPNAQAREQLWGFIQAHPEIAGQFPGGMLQMLEMLGQGGLEDMMVGAMGEGAEMPGQMPGFEGVMQEDMQGEEGNAVAHQPGNAGSEDQRDDDDEDDDEDGENIPSMPRALGNLFRRFWGRTPVVEESSDDEAFDSTGID